MDGESLLDLIARRVQAAGWRAGSSAGFRLDARLRQPVGYVAGRLVHTIRIVSDGRYVHAYPVED